MKGSGSTARRSPTPSSRIREATGHRTLAERPLIPLTYPAPTQPCWPCLHSCSSPRRVCSQGFPTAGGSIAPAAIWRHPEGPGSSIEGSRAPSRGACGLSKMAQALRRLEWNQPPARRSGSGLPVVLERPSSLGARSSTPGGRSWPTPGRVNSPTRTPARRLRAAPLR